jgi:hypothetical protein
VRIIAVWGSVLIRKEVKGQQQKSQNSKVKGQKSKVKEEDNDIRKAQVPFG